MKNITVKDVLSICDGKLICGNANDICSSYSKDTRSIQKNDVYLGIKGEKFNGSDFYLDALQKGAKGCILQDIEVNLESVKNFPGTFIIIVKNVVEAIQKLAKYKRTLYDIPVIGITGSVGKTSTKDLVSTVLSTKFDVLKTDGNYNNEIGLPLTILKLKEQDMAVLEMGMSMPKEMSLLTDIARPTTVVITTIGSSHIGNLGSRENILKAKLEILEGLKENGAVIVNNDNDLLNEWVMHSQGKYRCVTYGINQNSDIMAKNIEILENKTSFELVYGGKIYSVEIPVGGTHFVYNSLAAVAVGIEYNIAIEDIIKSLREISITKRRMELLKLENGVTLVNDSYNASYESVKAALEYINAASTGRRIAVLGDVLELGDFSKEMHEAIGHEVVKNKIDVLITVGKEAKNINEVVKNSSSGISVYSFENNEAAIKKLKETMKKGDFILIKASNGMHFDQIVDGLKC